MTVHRPLCCPTSPRAPRDSRSKAAGNIFFDLCNANFSIVPGIPAPVVSLESATLVAENCPVANGAIDPGETVTLDFALKNTGSLDTTNLVATLLATNGVTLSDGPKISAT